MPEVISDAFALAIVVFAISVSMGKILARRHGYEIESNQVHCSYVWIYSFSWAGVDPINFRQQ